MLVLAVLVSFTARVLSDALHVPGYYDLTGVVLAYEVMPLPWSILASVAIPLTLSLYYAVYMPALWIYVVVGLVYWVLARKTGRNYLAVLLSSIVYGLSWIFLYMVFTNTFSYLPILLRMKGFYILLLDSMVSVMLVKSVLEVKHVRENIVEGRNARYLCLAIVLLSIAVSLGYYTVQVNEWSVVEWFKDFDWLKRFHTKMDFVWLPLGEKGINNYYYPHDRFDRGSIGYQVWIGMYWIQGRRDVADVGLVSQFAIWDQNFWLGIHGCPSPYTYVDVVYNITRIKYKGYDAWFMEGGMVSRSDVYPYEEVRLRGFFITFYDPARDRTAIIYACATEENIDEIKDRLLEVVMSWDIGR